MTKKQRKPLPKAAVFALMVVGAIVVVFGGRMLLVGPQNAKAADLKKQADAARAEATQRRSDAQTRNAAPKIHVADVYRLQKAMPSTVDMPDLLLELNAVARDAGITLDTISPQGPTPGAGFQMVPIHLTFDGNFYTVTDLLFRLRNLVSVHHGRLDASGRLFSVDTITLTPNGAKLTTDMTVNAYVYGGTAAPAVPGAVPGAPAAPGSTDSTATTTTPAPAPSDGSAASGAPSG